MFNLLSPQKKKDIFKIGRLYYRQTIPMINFESKRIIGIPCLIPFINKSEEHSFPHNIFKFELSLTEKIFIMSNLQIDINSLGTIDEQSQHFLLEWTIIEAQKWAKRANKERIMIETTLPHCTEHFAEHGYDIKQYYSSVNVNGYRGIKDLL